MSIEYELIKDDVTANDIAADEPFLQREVSKFHADGFTLGLSMDENKPDTSKNHWAITLETPGKYIRLGMESRMNDGTGPTVKVQDILDVVFAQGWHKYKMLTTINGAKKGCRHHIQTILAGLQSRNWIDSQSDTGKSVEDFLPFVYTRDAEDAGELSIKKRSIDIGRFLR